MFPIIRLIIDSLLSLRPDWRSRPNPRSAERADVLCYRDDVPARLYAIGALVIPVALAVAWAVAGLLQGHSLRPDLFVVAAAFGWPLTLVWMHYCLTGRYPEVPYIWCDATSVSVEGRCTVAWDRLIAIEPILQESRYGTEPFTVGLILRYPGRAGTKAVRIRNPRITSELRSVYEDLRERATAAGAVLEPPIPRTFGERVAAIRQQRLEASI